MAQTSPARGPIPLAMSTDSEDVAWALSTAEAMYACGDTVDALKWLRRAAGAASENHADERALELAKAAADFAIGGAALSSIPAAIPPSAKAFPPSGPYAASPSGSTYPSADSSRPPPDTSAPPTRRVEWR